ncbi:hypothetical protein AHAS_Ahas17G0050400 [Arachis hypogaea]
MEDLRSINQNLIGDVIDKKEEAFSQSDAIAPLFVLLGNSLLGFAPMISCLYAIEWRCMWTQISFSLHFHPQLEFKKMHPPREAWRLKVRVLRLWVVPSFGNNEVPNSMEMILLDEHCGKIQATVKKPLLNRFRDLIVEGQVYRMAYFTVVSNHDSYRATSHEFKLVFLHQTTVVAVDEDVIPKT